IDLVQQQILVARGEPLEIRQQDVMLRGHAIECRLYAEDPTNNFLPAAGEISALALPSGPGVRVDSALRPGARITIDYDPLLAKVIAAASTRELARRRMIAALEDFLLIGPPNNLSFLRNLMTLPEFRDAAIDTQLIERTGAATLAGSRHGELAVAIAAFLASEPAASVPTGAEGVRELPTPWETLRGWRPGMGGSGDGGGSR
ncbi:MAG: hypothetical protein ACREQQ_14535, partial [Candidatus Binatia bacterium]